LWLQIVPEIPEIVLANDLAEKYPETFMFFGGSLPRDTNWVEPGVDWPGKSERSVRDEISETMSIARQSAALARYSKQSQRRQWR